MVSLSALHKRYPFKSFKKFYPIAKENGYTKQQTQSYLDSLVHDQHVPEQRSMFLPIYSEHPGAYQFDTLINPKCNPPYFLIIININTRKLYAYPMSSKSSEAVFEALTSFINEVKVVTNLTSDQDRAYLSKPIIDFMIEHKIDYRTTTPHDHNRLGIINRAIRTIRDLADVRKLTTASMKKLLDAYNNSIHSSIQCKPNSMTDTDEQHYIHKMRAITDTKHSQFNLPKGSYVRTVQPKTFAKRRSNISNQSYVVDDLIGNKYIIKAKDHSVAEYPRHQLIPTKNKNIAKSIDANHRGIIDKIIGFKNNRYIVQYEGGEKDSITPQSLREGRPSKLSPMEIIYWNSHRNSKALPSSLRRLCP